MSSPISSLKKTKRSPLHSPSKPVASTPFRHPDFTDDQIQHLTENASSIRFIRTMRPFRQSDRGLSLLETISSSPRSEKDDSVTSQDGDESPTLSSTDHELISLLMSRLVQLENRLTDAQKQTMDKEKKILILEDKVRMYERVRDGFIPVSTCDSELEHKCNNLQKQIYEMEKFLNDYGMIWIGDKRAEKHSLSVVPDGDNLRDERVGKSTDRSWRPGGESPLTNAREFHIDYDLVVGNIKELNILAGDGLSRVDVSPSGARLKTTEPIPLTLYANGILMFTGPFRSFTETSTRECVQDIMDGFYPSELQPLYPDGVPFKVIDKRHVVYRPRQIPFVGEGMVLSGDSSSESSARRDVELRESLPHNVPGPACSTQSLLEKLPKVVVHSGKIFDIRESIAQTLKDRPCKKKPPIIIPTKSTQNGNSKAKCISVRLKSETCSHIYLLNLNQNDTIGDLCNYLDSYRSQTPQYQIISLCPYKAFTDKSSTLLDCGFVSNVALFLRPCPSVQCLVEKEEI